MKDIFGGVTVPVLMMCFPTHRGGEDDNQRRKSQCLKLVAAVSGTGVVILETNLLVLSISVPRSSQQ